ncbi:MAG: replicative DNA helicase [Chitinispirillia bacterium]|nr:replicative DNA helicase [Chitinispirillia bacterium]MCL2268001.1 replicative DNA helicase [Chitinispirillia bacterium]
MQEKKESRIRKTPAPAAHFADRVPPQAKEVERTILGSMLISESSVDVAIEQLRDDYFYADAHKKIFICMRELSEKSTPVDTITVAEKLRQKEWIEAVGTEAYLAELAGNVVTSGNIQHYASIVREKAVLRQLIDAAGEITTDCFDPGRPVQEVLDAAEGKIFGIAESRESNKPETIGELMPRIFDLIETYKAGGSVSGVPTGFTKLDRMTTGFHGGDLVIIGGRPGMGKTSFCLSIALNASVRAGYGVVIFSLEMPKEQLVQRMLCSEARVNMHSLRSGTLPSNEYGKLAKAAGPLYEAPLYIDDTAGISVLDLRAKARRIQLQMKGKKLGLLIVDYLQLMRPTVASDSIQQDISMISRTLKAVARELNVPIIALSQLNRSLEQRKEDDRRPKLSDLRESGAIEQDADVVMFVYREEVYKKDQPDLEGKAEIIVEKQRNGPTGKVDVAFIKGFASFEDAKILSDHHDLPEDFA